MKQFKLLFVLLLASHTLSANEPLWLRYPSISPDGESIAFNYRGDIYLVSTNGGKATLLTDSEACQYSYEYSPVWSPDGSQIAFASDRHGNFDIFTIPSEGGEMTQVTTHTNDETPWAFSPDAQQIYFSANLQTSAASRVYTKKVNLRELYSVPTKGGRPTLILPTPAEEISFINQEGDFLYQDRPASEEIWRKHHRSAATRDIWLYKDGEHSKLTTFNGEDCVPRLSSDGRTVYFLSERNGSFNIFSFSLDNPDEVTCHTEHKPHPVRSLTVSDKETLCYSYDGEIYVKHKGKKTRKIKIDIPDKHIIPPAKYTTPIKGSDNAAVSPDGNQMAFIFRGELYVTATDGNPLTRRLTHTTASESDPTFSPDGRTLIYASERQGNWNLYSISLSAADSDFISAEIIEEKQVFSDSKYDRRAPQYSPDGKEISFIEDRGRLMVLDTEDGTTRTVTDGKHILNTWGTYPYSWSPDGKWFVLEGDIDKHKTNILLVNASGQEPIINLTRSGYPDSSPVWAAGGDAILFLSERYGSYDHSRVGGGSKSLFIYFLNKEAEERYTIPKERHQTLGITTIDDGQINEVDIEPFGFNDRILRLTGTPISNFITDKEGRYVYGISRKQLVRLDLQTPMKNMEVLGKANGTLAWNKDQSTIFILSSPSKRYDIATKEMSFIQVSGEYEIDPDAEYMFMYDHIVNEMRNRFYDKNMHGTDWEMYSKAYRRFVPHINNNYDFSELAGELLGELNVSHTGLRYNRPVDKRNATAELGVYIDYEHSGVGLKVEEILAGGPFDLSTSILEPGDIIERINGYIISPGMDYYPLLKGNADRKTLITVRKSTGETIDCYIYPISRDKYNELIYQRWMARCAADVERLSNGRLGYVHLDFMNKSAYHHLYLQSLGKYYNCEGLVLDVRHNGGGSLHPKIEEFFCGEQYLTGAIRGERIKDMPRRRWIRPSAMLICEGCYSDGHGSPWVYDHLDLGTTVGMPIPGTMTTCNREKMRDPSLVLGVPIVGFYTKEGISLENTQQEPDVRVEEDKNALANGIDKQLEAIIQILLEEVKTHPKRIWDN